MAELRYPKKSMEEWQVESHEVAKASGFWEGVELEGLDPSALSPVQQTFLAAKLALCHSELSEALEELRKGTLPVYVDEETGKPEGLGIELADTIIRIADLAQALGIQLEDAMHLKAEFNKGRPYKHGKAF